MTKKDITQIKNLDLEKETRNETSYGNNPNEPPKDSTGKTYVKNAHAAGDGAFGRTETGIPDEETTGGKREEDPPY